MSVTSSEPQQSLIKSTRVQQVPQLLPSSDKSITHEKRGWDEQLKFHDSRRLKRKAASSELNCFGNKCPTNSTSQTHQLGNPNKTTIDPYRRQSLTRSEPGSHLNSSLKDVYNTRFTSKESNDWKNIKPLNRVPSAPSYSSSILPPAYAFKPVPFSTRLSSGNLTDVSTISLSRFPHPPRLGYSRVNHSSTSFGPEDNQPLLPFTSPIIIQFADGTFDLLNPHKSLYDTMIEYPEEENGKILEPSFAISQKMQPLEKAPEQSGEVDTDSHEGSIRPRPLYDDLNSAYQSITSRKTDAYVLQAEPPFQLKPQLQALSTFKHSAPTIEEKDLTASDTQITSKSKRESNPRFFQRVVRAFSMRKSASDDSIAQKTSSKHRSKNRGYLSDIFFSNGPEVKENEKTPQRDISSNDIDVEKGRRRPIPASFNSLFDWTDDESDYPPSVYYRNSFSCMDTSLQGMNEWSMGDNDYSIEFGSNPYMHRTTTNDYREDSLSFSEGIEPRIESTIGSILNRYDHGREPSQAISSAISNSKSSVSSNANYDNQHTAEDNNAHADSINSYRRPMSKMLPPPLLQRANPTYSGHPPLFPLPTPNARMHRSYPSTRPEWSVPSNLYSTSSSYGNTRDLLLISQSATSICPIEMSDLAFIALSSHESDTKSRGTETETSGINEIAAPRVINHGTDVSNFHSDRIPGQQLSPHAATFHDEALNETVNLLPWDKDATKVKTCSNETAICKALDYNDHVEVQRSAQILESNYEAFQSILQKGEDLHDELSQSQAIKRKSRSIEDGADLSVNHVDDHLDYHIYEDNESQDWETVADPSQPNFIHEGLPRLHFTDDNKFRSEGGEKIPVFNHVFDDSPLKTEYTSNGLDPHNTIPVLQEANEFYQNNLNTTAYIPDFTSLIAEPHDDIEYNINYSWKGVADHAQAYNNRKIDDSTGQDKFFSNNLLQNTENENFAVNNDTTSTSGLILQSSPVEGSTRHTLRRTKNFEFIEQSSRPNESSREAGQQLHSGDLLINNCRSAQPSQIYIPPRYKSLKPENLVLQKEIVHHDESRVGIQPSQVIAQEERDLPRMSLVPKNRRKRASVPSQTRLMSFSLTSRDKLLLKSPTSHGSPNSNFVYHTHSSSTSFPRKFDSAPCLRRRNATAAANSNSRRRLKLKLSLLLFGVCCFFPPALVCYGVGWMDPVIFSLSHGKVEHIGRTQKRVALFSGSFVCTVGVVITITVIVMLHLEKT